MQNIFTSKGGNTWQEISVPTRKYNPTNWKGCEINFNSTEATALSTSVTSHRPLGADWNGDEGKGSPDVPDAVHVLGTHAANPCREDPAWPTWSGIPRGMGLSRYVHQNSSQQVWNRECVGSFHFFSRQVRNPGIEEHTWKQPGNAVQPWKKALAFLVFPSTKQILEDNQLWYLPTSE